MLFQQRRGSKGGFADVERETHHRIELPLVHPSAQTIDRTFEALKVGREKLLGSFAGDREAWFHVRASVTHADREDACRTEIGLKAFAFESSDKRPTSGRRFQEFILIFMTQA